MTLLPIVERELRVASRHGGTYRMRAQIAGIAAAAFAASFLFSLASVGVPFGRILFWGLSGICFLYSALAGRLMTADCISAEKREGTLGLLFLTDLKGYDVVLGKLAATSVDGFYRMLAIVPILAFPLLMGGLTNGEFWRMALTLIVTFIFSLSIGLCASALHRDQERAMGSNLALLLWLWGLPPAIGGALIASVPGFTEGQSLFYTCPVYAFVRCDDTLYRKAPMHFWGSIGTICLLTFFLLWLACRITPRSWQDKPESKQTAAKHKKPQRKWWLGSRARADAFRKRALDQNAYLWLAGKPHVKSLWVWIAVFVAAMLWLFSAMEAGSMVREVGFFYGITLNIMLVLWIITEASRQFALDKKIGAFELTLCTPLTSEHIVRGQRLALRKQFLKPFLAALCLEFLALLSIGPGRDAARLRSLWIGIMLVSAGALVACGWFGMLAGFTSKTYGRATVKTAFCILFLPFIIFGVVELLTWISIYLFERRPRDPAWPYHVGCWLATTLLTQLWFATKARARLLNDFRRLALEPSQRKRLFAWLLDLTSGTPERKTEIRTKFRRVGLAAVLSLSIVAVLALYDVHRSIAKLPKPLLISTTSSSGQTRVFKAGDELLIHLPNGSLWSWGRQTKPGPPTLVSNGLGWAETSAFYGGKDAIFGLRSNGALWIWPTNGKKLPQLGTNTDWVEFSITPGVISARKADGSLWTHRTRPKPGTSTEENPDFARVGGDSDWKAVDHAYHSCTWGLRSNGTLWVWGSVSYLSKGLMNITTNYDAPVQACAGSNFVDFYDGGREHGVRDSSNQLWSLRTLISLPKASSSISNVAQFRARSGLTAAEGILFHSNTWINCFYEVRTNGSLWATPTAFSLWNNLAAPSGPAIRVGQRTDWVAVWGAEPTMLGLTTDGTIWTWGLDYEYTPGWVDGSKYFVKGSVSLAKWLGGFSALIT